MSRKHSNFSRDVLPDPKFGSEVIARFINMVMQSGKKSTAERIVYGAMDTMEERNKSATPVELIEQALENVSPMVEVKSRRVGGATYQVPVEVRPKRRQALAMRRALWGDGHPDVPETMSALGLLLQETSRNAEAEYYDRQALRLRKPS